MENRGHRITFPLASALLLLVPSALAGVSATDDFDGQTHGASPTGWSTPPDALLRVVSGKGAHGTLQSMELWADPPPQTGGLTTSTMRTYSTTPDTFAQLSFAVAVSGLDPVQDELSTGTPFPTSWPPCDFSHATVHLEDDMGRPMLRFTVIHDAVSGYSIRVGDCYSTGLPSRDVTAGAFVSVTVVASFTSRTANVYIGNSPVQAVAFEPDGTGFSALRVESKTYAPDSRATVWLDQVDIQ